MRGPDLVFRRFLTLAVFVAAGAAIALRAAPPEVPAQDAGTRAMVQLLAERGQDFDRDLVYQRPDRRLMRYARGVKPGATDPGSRLMLDAYRAYELLLLGQPEEAAALFQSVKDAYTAQPEVVKPHFAALVQNYLAVSYLRVAEQENCVHRHQAQSCIFPIRGSGVHSEREGSRRALREYTGMLDKNPEDLAARWLLNIAAMTLGEHPDGVPAQWLIPVSLFDSEADVGRFRDAAIELGIDALGLTGGSVLEDFDGDGDMDLLTSSNGLNPQRDQLRYFRNDGPPGFTDQTAEAGLTGLVGGANLVQADYDNDGDVDVLVLRGGWLQGPLGEQPPSLLRNEGGGRFVDRTEQAGMLAHHPSQAAAWGDYDNDGWLDVFVGVEWSEVRYFDMPVYLRFTPTRRAPCRLYRNNRDGTFTDVAAAVGLDVYGYVKGAAWGDYDNDGRLDLVVTQMYGPTRVFRNLGRGRAGRWRFVEAATLEPNNGYTTWFWDYDNDGWLDLWAAAYWPAGSAYAAGEVASSYLGRPVTAERGRLYHNQRGRFRNVTVPARLDRVFFANGGNFGDIDNDGWPDVYFSTGADDYRALIPNRMFRNAEGRTFQDVTTSAGVGHLQKGAAVSFGDIDGDGDQDIYLVVGGEYPGDGFPDAFFLNPGNGNQWVTLRLQGVRSNRSAIGARIQVTVDTEAGPRQVHAVVGSGGSFGANTLQQEMGLGRARAIRSVRVRWPAGRVETFSGVPLGKVVTLREGTGRAAGAGRAAPRTPARSGPS